MILKSGSSEGGALLAHGYNRTKNISFWNTSLTDLMLLTHRLDVIRCQDVLSVKDVKDVLWF